MNEMVTITREEYDRLREAAEDLADLQVYDAAMADRSEGMPAELVRRMVEGEAPLRVFRDWRGLTQAQLSEASGVNRVQIANIEAGTRTGSVETLKRLAAALGVGVDDLV